MALKVVLPGVLVALAFLLKLLIDQTADLPKFIRAIAELPVDIAFLAISFIAAFAIGEGGVDPGLLHFLVFVVGGVVVVFLWRRSVRCFETDHVVTMMVLTLLSYGISVYGLVRATTLLCGGPAK